MFSYMMKTQGAQINHFEKSPQQMAYEQAIGQWSQVAFMVAEKGGDINTVTSPAST